MKSQYSISIEHRTKKLKCHGIFDFGANETQDSDKFVSWDVNQELKTIFMASTFFQLLSML